MQVLLLIVGFFVLIKGADLFVDGASSIADYLRIPAVVVGLTIVAFGTSAPEAAVSIAAGLSGSNDIAIGNVVGSNIFNILAVVGISCLIKSMKIDQDLIKNEIPYMIGAGLLMCLFCFTGQEISRIEGSIFTFFILLFVYMTVKKAIKGRNDQQVNQPKYSIWMSIVVSIIGLAFIIVGGNVVVDSAKQIALSFGMSEMLVGLTIVSIGTSLPELVTSVVAAKKGHSDIAIGNVVGSNIFNILFILGLASMVRPIGVEAVIFTDLAIMMVVFILSYVIAKVKQSYDWKVGIVFVLMLICYLSYIIIRN